MIDVKKAHLNGKVPDDVNVFVKLPDRRVWKLKRWLYGMRPAANAWEKNFSDKLLEAGFKKGKSSPTAFFRSRTDCRLVVHGNDFTFLCWEDEASNIIEDMKRWYDIKVRAVLGGGPNDDEEATILGRRMRWSIT